MDYRNHRCFTLKCIKVRITPVSCKTKNPLQSKTAKSYQITHKAEGHLLYERVRNINRVLQMYEPNQYENYIHLKNEIWEDDLYTCIQFINMAEHGTHLLQHINSHDPKIQFTVEQPGTDGSIPFLDTKVTPGPNNTIHTTVYSKPTHTGQYLNWDSNHFIAAKHRVYNTLAHRAKVVSSNPTELAKELGHLREALQACLFPTWALNKLQHQFEYKHNNREATEQNNNTPTTTTPVSPPPPTNTESSPWWYPTYMVWERSSRGLAINRVCKFISKEPTPSSHFSWHQKTRTINFK